MELTNIPELNVSLGETIGSGAFGLVRRGTIEGTGEKIAVKLESTAQKRPLLLREAELMQELQQGPGMPHIYGAGTINNCHYLALQLLGKSLFDRFREIGRFSVPEIVKCAEQILTSFQFLYKSSVIHRDIKPENFLFAQSEDHLYVIDFGLARKVVQSLLFMQYQGRACQIVGTLPFVSVNIHLGMAPAFRDDLESIAYMLIYLLQGSLPWYSPTAQPFTEKQTRSSKQSFAPYNLCQNLPVEFEMMLKYARGLSVEERLDYALLIKAFNSLGNRLKIELKETVLGSFDGKNRRRSKSERKKELGVDQFAAISQASSFHISSIPGESNSPPSRKKTKKRTKIQPFRGFNGHKAEILRKMVGDEGKIEEERKELLPIPKVKECSLF